MTSSANANLAGITTTTQAAANNGSMISASQFVTSVGANGLAAAVLIGGTTTTSGASNLGSPGNSNSMRPFFGASTPFQIGPDTGLGAFEGPAPQLHRTRRPTSGGQTGAENAEQSEPQQGPVEPVNGQWNRSNISPSAETENQQSSRHDPNDADIDSAVAALDLDVSEVIVNRLLMRRPLEKLRLFSYDGVTSSLRNASFDLIPELTVSQAAVAATSTVESTIEPATSIISTEENEVMEDPTGHYVSRFAVEAAAAATMYLPLLVTELEKDEPRSCRDKRGPIPARRH